MGKHIYTYMKTPKAEKPIRNIALPESVVPKLTWETKSLVLYEKYVGYSQLFEVFLVSLKSFSVYNATIFM
jgi:hypothetical protein